MPLSLVTPYLMDWHSSALGFRVFTVYLLDVKVCLDVLTHFSHPINFSNASQNPGASCPVFEQKNSQLRANRGWFCKFCSKLAEESAEGKVLSFENA